VRVSTQIDIMQKYHYYIVIIVIILSAGMFIIAHYQFREAIQSDTKNRAGRVHARSIE